MHVAPPGKKQLIPAKNVFVTLPAWTLQLDWGVHRLSSEVNFLLETLQVPEVSRVADTLQAPLGPAARDSYPAALASPDADWAVFLTIDVDADARRISQALTEPEYLEAWIRMPDQAAMPGEEGESSIVVTKEVNGYRLDQYRDGRVVAGFVGSFLFCHQRKMRLTWRDTACPDLPESLIDFRIRGNFGGSILELRHRSFQSVGEFIWHQQLWSASLARLASILRSV